MNPLDLSLLGKVAVITGANRGIGRAIALQLAEQGASVVLSARDEARLAEVLVEVRNLERAGIAIALDLRLPSSAEQLVSYATSAFGRVDILINNAGATKRGAFLDLTDEDWADGYSLKLFGAVRLTRACWPSLAANRGSVVNIAGVGGRTPGPEFSIGGSVNAALLSFTKAVADLGIRDRVQVNAINPGAVRTDRLAKRLQQEAEAQGIAFADAEQNFILKANVTRFGEPEDIGALVGFIVSPAGRFLHGALIDMDGGQTKTL